MDVLEQQRRNFELLNRLEYAAVEELLDEPRSHRDRLAQEHRVARSLRRSLKVAEKINALNPHIAASAASGNLQDSAAKTSEDVMLNNAVEDFYGQLSELQEYHAKYPDEPVTDSLAEEFGRRPREDELKDLGPLFTGEETWGKFLDLNELYERFVNIKATRSAAEASLPASTNEHASYLQWLNDFEHTEKIPETVKNSSVEYLKYLTDLNKYLETFIAKALPLDDLEMLKAQHESKFKAQWMDEDGGVGEREDGEVYCKYCAKLFAKRSVYDAHLAGKKHLKAVENFDSSKQDSASANTPNNTAHAPKRSRVHQIAYQEHLLRALMEPLEQVRAESRAHLERKQTLTLEELVARGDPENEDESTYIALYGEPKNGDNAGETGSDDELDEDRLYNPLKLPLGWDGKPIPYWLYRLHGLGVEYPCEICGNYVYMGRRVFEKHFQEWRHAHGMKCLGIPNSKEFFEITSIADAQTLWTKLSKKQERNDTDVIEEHEDAEGNVFNKKTYEDLKRQGLL